MTEVPLFCKTNWTGRRREQLEAFTLRGISLEQYSAERIVTDEEHIATDADQLPRWAASEDNPHDVARFNQLARRMGQMDELRNAIGAFILDFSSGES